MIETGINNLSPQNYFIAKLNSPIRIALDRVLEQYPVCLKDNLEWNIRNKRNLTNAITRHRLHELSPFLHLTRYTVVFSADKSI